MSGCDWSSDVCSSDLVVWGVEAFGLPFHDTWWQTETGAIMITPVPGILIDSVDDNGTRNAKDNGGLITITEPWPSMLRGIWGDPERFIETYWEKFGTTYFAGDGARRDSDGDVWLLGRVDDVMNISGHRLSTAEIESALVSNPMVAEAAVVGAADELTGQAVVAFVIIKSSHANEGTPEEKSTQLRAHVATQIGAIARPARVYLVPELPKTRSGKIMRRLLRDVAEGRPIGDTTTLTDPAILSGINPQSALTLPATAERNYSNATTISTSTGASSGSTDTPTAERP